MRCMVSAIVAGVALVGSLLLAGCGGSSGESAGGTTGLKIAEYRGDGHGGTKPMPPFAAPAALETKALGTMLGVGSNYVDVTVPRALTHFFRLAALSVGRTMVVTLQQVGPTEDADLYLFPGYPSGSGMDCLAYSNRTPAPGGVDDWVNGCVPDWVVCDLGPSSPWPAGTVAVYGVTGEAATKRCRLEADQAIPLTVGAANVPGMVTQYNSKWYYFDTLPGTAYTVRLTFGTLGDPDTYVYAGDSNHYVGKNTNAGGGDLTFTTGAAVRHWVRVHGFLGGKNNYLLRVTSP